MTQTEQRIRPVLTDYREGLLGALEDAVWMSNAIAADGSKKQAAILAGITGVGMAILTYLLLRSA